MDLLNTRWIEVSRAGDQEMWLDRGYNSEWYGKRQWGITVRKIGVEGWLVGKVGRSRWHNVEIGLGWWVDNG